MTSYLFNTKQVELIAMCPVTNNENVLKCYEKSGFIIKKKFNTENTIGEIETFLLVENTK